MDRAELLQPVVDTGSLPGTAQASGHLRLLVSTAIAGAALLIFSLAVAVRMGAPEHDAVLLGLTLVVSGLSSLVLALVLLRLAEQSPRIGLATRLIIPGALAIAVMLLNIWFTAAMMFISNHDLALLAVLLTYSGALGLVASFVLARSITGGLEKLNAAVRRMATGESSARVAVDTADEVGALGTAFNRMAEQAETAERGRLENETARRALLAAVSHDLRTPLSAIRVMLEAIEDGVADDEQTITRYHRAMHAEVSRLSTLIDDLFELTQIEAGALRLSLERTDIASLISEMLEAMQAEADREGIGLMASVDVGLQPVNADGQKLFRVLLNLITNALRHTPRDGTVTLIARESEPGVAITIADTGEGIASEDLPHVFERFYRGDKSRSRAGGGAGLGLAIARGIVEAHGGTIGVESLPGQGTAFTFTLPRSG